MPETVSINRQRSFLLPETFRSTIDTRANIYLTLWLQLDEKADKNAFKFLLWQAHEGADLLEHFNQKITGIADYTLKNILRRWFFPNTEEMVGDKTGKYKLPKRLYGVLGHTSDSLKQMTLETHNSVKHALVMDIKSHGDFEDNWSKNRKISTTYSNQPMPSQVDPLPTSRAL